MEGGSGVRPAAIQLDSDESRFLSALPSVLVHISAESDSDFCNFPRQQQFTCPRGKGLKFTAIVETKENRRKHPEPTGLDFALLQIQKAKKQTGKRVGIRQDFRIDWNEIEYAGKLRYFV